MIVFDVESSGLDIGRCGIWQIGAVDTETGKEFLEEARIDDDDITIPEALLVTGKTEEELRDKNKQSQKQLIENFLDWLGGFDERIIAGHNGWDVYIIQNKCMKYGLYEKVRKIMGYKLIDSHTVAQLQYKKQHGRFKVKEGKSSMGLPSILELCGIEDPRMIVSGNEVVKEGKPHNALEDAKLTAKCLMKLLGGENE